MIMLSPLPLLMKALRLKTDLELFLPVFVLLTSRLLAATLFIPFFGREVVPGRVRLGLAIACAAFLYPAVAGRGPTRFPLGLYMILLLKEVLIGALIGIFVGIVFSATVAAAYLVEFQAGLRPMAIFAPQLSSEASPLGQLLSQATLCYFLAADMHLWVIRGFADSYQILPLFWKPAGRDGLVGFATLAGALSSGFFTLAIQLSAPFLFLLLLMYVGSHVIFRVAGLQVQSHPLQPLSTLALYGFLLFGAGLIPGYAWHHASHYLAEVHSFLIGLSGVR
jgi:flagellar biosynthesis protein FliR